MVWQKRRRDKKIGMLCCAVCWLSSSDLKTMFQIIRTMSTHFSWTLSLRHRRHKDDDDDCYYCYDFYTRRKGLKQLYHDIDFTRFLMVFYLIIYALFSSPLSAATASSYIAVRLIQIIIGIITSSFFFLRLQLVAQSFYILTIVFLDVFVGTPGAQLSRWLMVLYDLDLERWIIGIYERKNK